MEDFGFFGSSLKDALSDSVYFYEIASRDWREPEYRSEVCSIASKPRFIINPKMPACEPPGGGRNINPPTFSSVGSADLLPLGDDFLTTVPSPSPLPSSPVCAKPPLARDSPSSVCECMPPSECEWPLSECEWPPPACEWPCEPKSSIPTTLIPRPIPPTAVQTFSNWITSASNILTKLKVLIA